MRKLLRLTTHSAEGPPMRRGFSILGYAAIFAATIAIATMSSDLGNTAQAASLENSKAYIIGDQGIQLPIALQLTDKMPAADTLVGVVNISDFYVLQTSWPYIIAPTRGADDTMILKVNTTAKTAALTQWGFDRLLMHSQGADRAVVANCSAISATWGQYVVPITMAPADTLS